MFGGSKQEQLEHRLDHKLNASSDGIDMDAAGIRIMPKGRLLGRNVAMVFDEYLAKKHSNRFSKVI